MFILLSRLFYTKATTYSIAGFNWTRLLLLKAGEMERWNGRVALVTGASAGIGAGICIELVKHGLIVVGCARRVEKIQALANVDEVKSCTGKIHAVRCDMTQESDILAMFDEIRSKFGRIDICINNAGIANHDSLLSGQTSGWKKVLDVNVLALCICSREAIKLMREKNIDDGQIIQISSIAGHSVLSSTIFMGSHFYSGTKFMIRALTEGLRREVAAANIHIRVASISPGIVETEIATTTLGEEAAKKLYSSVKCLQSKDVADAVIYILQSPPHVDVNDIIMQPV